MGNTISINSNEMAIREYNGQRVVTFKDIDTVHSRPSGTAGRNFRKNRNHFIEGTDYFKIQPDEIRQVGITSPSGGIVLTESGYLMLAKSFTDDLAWTVQRELVNNYFRVEKLPNNETKFVKPSFDELLTAFVVLRYLRCENIERMNVNKNREGREYVMSYAQSQVTACDELIKGLAMLISSI